MIKNQKKILGKVFFQKRKKRCKEFRPKKISKPPYMVARDAVSESAVKVQRKVILLLHYALQCRYVYYCGSLFKIFYFVH